jgi:hypothetical protein
LCGAATRLGSKLSPRLMAAQDRTPRCRQPTWHEREVWASNLCRAPIECGPSGSCHCERTADPSVGLKGVRENRVVPGGTLSSFATLPRTPLRCVLGCHDTRLRRSLPLYSVGLKSENRAVPKGTRSVYRQLPSVETLGYDLPSRVARLVAWLSQGFVPS